MDLERGCKMPSTQNTKPDESLKLSATEQRIHDAMSKVMPTPEAAAAAAEYNRSLPRPTEESLAQAAQETVDNMNRKARMGLL